MAGKLSAPAIAQAVGASRVSVNRYARHAQIDLKVSKYSDDLRRQVVAYYDKHGLAKTQAAFPQTRPLSIVAKSKHRGRYVKWKKGAIIHAAKMAGIIPLAVQAKLLNNPRTSAKGISEMWRRVIGMQGSHLHGCAQILGIVSVVRKRLKDRGEVQRRQHKQVARNSALV